MKGSGIKWRDGGSGGSGMMEWRDGGSGRGLVGFRELKGGGSGGVEWM